MKDLEKFWDNHGTKVLGVLGTVQSIIMALMAIPELIPASYVKYWAASGAVLGVLVYRRGFTNSARGDTGQDSGV